MSIRPVAERAICLNGHRSCRGRVLWYKDFGSFGKVWFVLLHEGLKRQESLYGQVFYGRQVKQGMLHGEVRELFYVQREEERIMLLNEGQGCKVNINATKG